LTRTTTKNIRKKDALGTPSAATFFVPNATGGPAEDPPDKDLEEELPNTPKLFESCKKPRVGATLERPGTGGDEDEEFESKENEGGDPVKEDDELKREEDDNIIKEDKAGEKEGGDEDEEPGGEGEGWESNEDVEMPSAKPKLGTKYVVLSGTFPHLVEGNGLDAGKAALKGIIASHRGIVDAKVQGRTNLLVIGNHPGRTKVRDAEHHAVQIVHIFTLEMYLGGVMTFKELIGTAPPEITEYSAGFSPNPPSEVQEASPTGGTTTQGVMTPATPPTPLHALPSGSNTNGIASMESDASVQLISPLQNQGNEITLANAEGQKRNVEFNNPIFKKRRDPISPPTATGITMQATNFIDGTVVTPLAGTGSTGSRGRRPPKLPTWTTVVTIKIRCGEGDI
jgi:hypothetical protein